jgi:hypothetical protein
MQQASGFLLEGSSSNETKHTSHSWPTHTKGNSIMIAKAIRRRNPSQHLVLGYTSRPLHCSQQACCLGPGTRCLHVCLVQHDQQHAHVGTIATITTDTTTYIPLWYNVFLSPDSTPIGYLPTHWKESTKGAVAAASVICCNTQLCCPLCLRLLQYCPCHPHQINRP